MTIEQLGTSLITVGKVLQALKGLSYEEGLRTLWRAERLLITQASPGIDEVEPVPSINRTLQVVSMVFDVDTTLLKQRSRYQETARARQVAMYVLVMTNGYTYTEIGQALGKRTPATVLYGYQQTVKRLGEDTILRRKVAEIMIRLTGKE